ncbi:MAG: hypothetical protein IKF38_02840 [Clostridia bacterium]|nr:hypothetical protein [Clostridia bacterium]
MSEMIYFLNNILSDLNINNINNLSIEQTRNIINDLNNFLYTYNNNSNYFSDYHKFWEQNCEKILNPKINIKKCEEVADVFHNIYINNKDAFYYLYSKEGLPDEVVCKIRFYTASQDFNGSRIFSDYAKIYKKNPKIFEKNHIKNDPNAFVKDLNFTILSQTDKRITFAKKSAEMLINLNCEPYELLEKFDNDIEKLRFQLVNNEGMGFGNKKADMFIRDMVVLKIWKNYTNFDSLDVASDINTMKVALRTGILQTEIPLVSSFLDIFSYQYGLINLWSAKAWREVWNIWKRKYKKECIEGPCLIDYLVYKIIGREFCNENLILYKCEKKGHEFKWYSSKKRKCPICAKEGINSAVKKIKRLMPCKELDGNIYFENNSFLSGNDAILKGFKTCPLQCVCKPTDKDFIKYNAPKSISIKGKTGWNSAKVKNGEGGGGLMS